MKCSSVLSDILLTRADSSPSWQPGSSGSPESLSSAKVGARRKLMSTSAPQFRDSQEKWPQQQETGSG